MWFILFPSKCVTEFGALVFREEISLFFFLLLFVIVVVGNDLCRVNDRFPIGNEYDYGTEKLKTNGSQLTVIDLTSLL